MNERRREEGTAAQGRKLRSEDGWRRRISSGTRDLDINKSCKLHETKHPQDDRRPYLHVDKTMIGFAVRSLQPSLQPGV